MLALMGLADAVYLTAQHLAGQSVKCVAVQGCDEVLTSPYATLPGGLPLAALGAIAYFAIFSLSTLVLFGYQWARRIIVLVVIPMLCATLWLFYLQAFVLQAYCIYCLLSAALTLAIAACVFGSYLFPALPGRRFLN
ncbi:MAG: vitamin K epoxide reductase family protein [Pyrinomonadaceae bacterium]